MEAIQSFSCLRFSRIVLFGDLKAWNIANSSRDVSFEGKISFVWRGRMIAGSRGKYPAVKVIFTVEKLTPSFEELVGVISTSCTGNIVNAAVYCYRVGQQCVI